MGSRGGLRGRHEGSDGGCPRGGGPVRPRGTAPHERGGTGSPPEVELCLAFIRDNYAHRYASAELARHARVSLSYVFRIFKRSTGFTPVHYRNFLRIEEAKRLLRSGAPSLEELARQVGFDDVRYFSRVFRKETGLSPGEFRKRSSGTNRG
jgi:AraC-like DNA-binding protein